MPLPRPLLLVLLGAVLVGAAFFATRGLGGTGVEPAADTATPPVKPAPESGAPATPKATEEPAAPKSEPKQQKSEPTQQKSEPKQQKSEPKREQTQPKQQKSDTVRGSRPAKRKAPALSTRQRVARAIKSDSVVLLFFRQRGADDNAVASAVNAQRGRKGVAVFTLPVGQAPKYAKVGGANVVRAPTIVILGRDRGPLLYEGFIDTTTLTQAVTDAR
jgi:hypothetical protein